MPGSPRPDGSRLVSGAMPDVNTGVAGPSDEQRWGEALTGTCSPEEIKAAYKELLGDRKARERGEDPDEPRRRSRFL